MKSRKRVSVEGLKVEVLVVVSTEADGDGVEDKVASLRQQIQFGSVWSGE